MLKIFNKDVKEMKGLTQEILDSFEDVVTSNTADLQEYSSINGDILYYYKEKPYGEYRLAAIYTTNNEFFQFGIVAPYKLNKEGTTMKEIHANSEYLKELKEDKVDEIPVDKQPEEPTVVTIEEPNSLQTDTYEYEGEKYYLVDFKWEPGEQGDTIIQTYKTEGTNKMVIVKRPIVPFKERDKPDITELTIHFMPEDPFEYDGKIYKRISTMDKLINGKWRPSFIYYNEDLNEQVVVTVLESEEEKKDNMAKFTFDGVEFTSETLEEYETLSRIDKLVKNKKFKKLVPGNDNISFAKVLNVNIFESIGKVISVRGIFVDRKTHKVQVFDLYSDTISIDEEFDLGDIEEKTSEKISDIIAMLTAEGKVLDDILENVSKESENL